MDSMERWGSHDPLVSWELFHVSKSGVMGDKGGKKRGSAPAFL